ncbi:MAG: O-methyltransferase [Thermodesulfobacteriota bacterium]
MNQSIDKPEEYFQKLLYPRDELLLQLEAEAAREGIPIIGPVVGELLYVLAKATRAEQVLELGTATGYSAIFLARGCEDGGGKVITLENDPVMAERAQHNIRKAGYENTVEVVLVDALAALAEMNRRFDLVFIDIEKEDYIRALPHLYRLLRPGGLLVADNVSYKGADSFNRAVHADKRWRSVSLYAYLPLHSPEKDAVCLAVRL